MYVYIYYGWVGTPNKAMSEGFNSDHSMDIGFPTCDLITPSPYCLSVTFCPSVVIAYGALIDYKCSSLDILWKHCLYLKLEKFTFKWPTVEYLGLICSEGHVEMDPVQVTVFIQD